MEYKQANLASLLGKHFRDEPVEIDVKVRGVALDGDSFIAIIGMQGQTPSIVARGRPISRVADALALLNSGVQTQWDMKMRGSYTTRSYRGDDNSSGELTVHYIGFYNLGFACHEEEQARQ
ncbi:hypothetical protein HYZ97_04120 [Candidatus Pacearchaeota archaeon]|nr:hypothetical protein [Candidatus Pacearchaeota archaeon]